MPLSTPPCPASTTTVYRRDGAPDLALPALATRAGLPGLAVMEPARDRSVDRAAGDAAPSSDRGRLMVGSTVGPSRDATSPGEATMVPRCGGDLLGAAATDDERC